MPPSIAVVSTLLNPTAPDFAGGLTRRRPFAWRANEEDEAMPVRVLPAVELVLRWIGPGRAARWRR